MVLERVEDIRSPLIIKRKRGKGKREGGGEGMTKRFHLPYVLLDTLTDSLI